MKRLLLLPLLLAALLAAPAQAVVYQPGSTVVVNQPTLTFGDSVSFTETVPREAFGGGHTPQFPGNPNTQVMCYQSSVLVWVQTTSELRGTKFNAGGGFRTFTTGELPLGGRTGGAFGDLDWPSGAASCTALVYSTYEQQQQLYQIIWASTTFEVAA